MYQNATLPESDSTTLAFSQNFHQLCNCAQQTAPPVAQTRKNTQAKSNFEVIEKKNKQTNEKIKNRASPKEKSLFYRLIF